ncbi:MAG: SDR family NAD(P)-dependent oxidoreductase, partial [Allosphingosinicella sp.]
MSDTDTVDMIHEDALPGHESELEPKPDWEPLYPGSGRLKGKVALITGADSGIGRATAALFAREGADVAILYLCEHDDARKTKEIVEGEGARAILIAGDVGDKAFCERAVKETVDTLGGLDILINNAGEQHP